MWCMSRNCLVCFKAPVYEKKLFAVQTEPKTHSLEWRCPETNNNRDESVHLDGSVIRLFRVNDDRIL